VVFLASGEKARAGGVSPRIGVSGLAGNAFAGKVTFWPTSRRLLAIRKGRAKAMILAGDAGGRDLSGALPRRSVAQQATSFLPEPGVPSSSPS
jgi:hypothetical protein